MSGYFFLTISLLTGTAKGYCGKKISRYTEKLTDAISISSVRMGICALFGFILILFQHKLSVCTTLTTTDILCILWSAIANSAFVVLWLCCVHSGAYMLVEISLTLGVPIAVCGSTLIPALHEPLQFRNIIGIIILVFASILMQGYNQKDKKKKLTPKDFAMLLALPFSSGLADLSQKYYIKTVLSADAAVFSFYSFLLSAVILVFFRLVQRQKSSISLSNIKNVLPYTVLMALFLYANIYFKTLAARIKQRCALSAHSVFFYDSQFSYVSHFIPRESNAALFFGNVVCNLWYSCYQSQLKELVVISHAAFIPLNDCI